jgi:DNA repair ATPase RecN
MTLEELGSKLSELDEMRRHAERELSALQDHQERVEQLEEDRDALIKEMAETAPDALDSLAGEERNKVYRMLRLEVSPTAEGYSITGALRVRMQNRTDALASMHNCINTEVRFRALLSQDETWQLEVVRA